MPGNSADDHDLDDLISEVSGKQSHVAEDSDPWANVPSVVRDKFVAMEHLDQRLRTSEGRVSAMQRELDIAKQAARAVEDAPSQRQINTAGQNTAKWKELQDEFPEWADAIDERLKGAGNDNAPELRAELDSLRQAKAQTDKDLAELRVSVIHPHWDEDVKTPEFAEWMKKQPYEIQTLASSDNPRDAIKLLDAYADQPAQAERARKVLDGRTNRLKASATNVNHNAGKPGRSEDELSSEEYWNALAKTKQRR